MSFGYGDELVLNQMNLSIAPARKSRSSAPAGGKSTLVQLLLGLYTPWPAFVSAVRLSKRWSGTVRENVAVVCNAALFNDTVRANLTMGRERSDEACWHALEIAQLHATIRDLPNGLDSIVGRSGVRLSGGQRQRWRSRGWWPSRKW